MREFFTCPAYVVGGWTTPGCWAIAVGSWPALPVSAKLIGEAIGARDQWRTRHLPTRHICSYQLGITRLVLQVFVLSLKFFIMAEAGLEVLFTLVHDRSIL